MKVSWIFHLMLGDQYYTENPLGAAALNSMQALAPLFYLIPSHNGPSQLAGGKPSFSHPTASQPHFGFLVAKTTGRLELWGGSSKVFP